MRQQIINESKKPHAGFDIFLSHSYLDKDEIEGLYIELTNKGLSVYVDWIVDPHLNREKVTKESAEHIRNRMKMSRSLLLAISDNATMSKWIPWELGYLDAHSQQCAILPISRQSNAPASFTRTEYLLLYPYIKLADLTSGTETLVVETGNEYTRLQSWAKSATKPFYQARNITYL